MPYINPSSISLEERTFYELQRHHRKMEEIAIRQRDAQERIAWLLEQQFHLATEQGE